MTYLLEVFIEYKFQQLNRPFTYLYHGPLHPKKGMRVKVPFQKQSLIGYITQVTPTEDPQTLIDQSPYSIVSISEILDREPILTEELLSLADYLTSRFFTSKIALLQAMLPQSLFPTKQGLKGPKIAFEDWFVITPIDPLPTMTPKQRQWWSMVKDLPRLRRHEIKSKAAQTFLLSAQLAKVERLEKRRFNFASIQVESRPSLTEDQSAVVDEFHRSKAEVYLLEGVTGSGKTEVYLTLSESVIAQGKSVLMVVPEIALTPVMMSYYHQRFGQRVAILHSGLTPAEKFDEYRRIIAGEISVVVGARSAIFAPLINLGLIILDEEHSETYKQDTSPFYHARDIALWRGHHHQCKVLMGTATPSLESKARAQKGRYHLLTLSKRVNAQAAPITTIVDMTKTSALAKESSLFSTLLLQGIQQRLEKKEQVILLVNRRGYAQSVVCRTCQETLKCPQCQISLTYHYQLQSMQCHYCDFVMDYPKTCPTCQGHTFMKQGFGSEQVVHQLQTIFPTANILRLDTDMSGVKSAVTSTLKKFQDHEADILVGTQMVAKGHDFPLVTLVGVMLADQGLHVPHYRAAERTFQLLAQVIGRTGRGTLPGEAIIQTTMPYHYAIVTGSKQDYPAFYQREMRERKALQYPPFTYLARYELLSTSQDAVDETAIELTSLLIDQLKQDAIVIGPNVPFPEFFAGQYRRRVLIKYKNFDTLYERLKDLQQILVTKTHVKIYLNVDPYDS